MKPVLSTEEVVRLEDIIEREGTSKAELMELAGEFAANEVLKLNPDRVLVLVGFGNNGGDGWVAADILSHKGVDVDIVSPVEPDEILLLWHVMLLVVLPAAMCTFASAPRVTNSRF
mgnify:CR=1 FL=1